MTRDPSLAAPAPGGWSRSPARAALALLLLVALGLLSLLPLRPPAVAGAGAPDSELSAERAREDLETIARAPHPVGSAEHARVRDHLLTRIAELGLSAEVQETVAARWLGGRLRGSGVENIAVRLPGRGGGAVALVAHYDSTWAGPGAGDDAAGVAALLEVLRILAREAPLENDLIFLFTDAEEVGLMGARAFVDQHPWAKDLRLVINFEARGARGPSIMFETGPGTGPLMSTFADLAPHPVAFSFSYDVYRRLPNDTDFTVFKQLRLPGFNFAFIHDFPRYHTTRDTVEALDLRSLQHHGAQALALARHFGEVDLEALPPGGPAVYFSLPVLGLVTYPGSWALPLAVLAALLAMAVVVTGLRRSRLTVGRLLLGLLALPASVAAAVGVVYLLALPVIPAFRLTPLKLGTGTLYLGGWALVAGAVAVFTLLFFLRRLGLAATAAASALWWLVLAVLTAVALPSSAYLVVWPLLFTLLGLLVLFRQPEGEAPSAGLIAALVVAAIPVLWIWVPTACLTATAFGVGSRMLLAVVVGLVLPLLAPQVALVTAGARRWPVPAAAGVLGLALVLSAAASAGYSPERPRPVSLLYALDRPAGKAYWTTFDRIPDAWAERMVGRDGRVEEMTEFFDVGPLMRPAAEAPALDLMSPEVTLLGEEPGEGGDRVLRLHVRPAPGQVTIVVRARSEGQPRIVSVAGRPVGDPPAAPDEEGVATLLIFGVPRDGFELEVATGGIGPLAVGVVGRSWGWPEVPGVEVKPRPPDRVPSQAPTDVTLVREVYQFDPRDTAAPPAEDETELGAMPPG